MLMGYKTGPCLCCVNLCSLKQVCLTSQCSVKMCGGMVRCYWKLVVNVQSGRSIRWSYKVPFIHVYRSNTSLSLSQRRMNGDQGNWCGLCYVGATSRPWCEATMVLKRGARNIFHWYQWAQDINFGHVGTCRSTAISMIMFCQVRL